MYVYPGQLEGGDGERPAALPCQVAVDQDLLVSNIFLGHSTVCIQYSIFIIYSINTVILS